MKRWIVAAMAALTMGATSAYANDPYIGVGVAVFNIDTGINKKTAAGEYLMIGDNFSQYLGGEVRIGTSGRTNDDQIGQPQTKIDYFMAAYAKPQYQLTDKFTAYGLLGVASVSASYTVPGSALQKKTRTGIAYGLGVDYRFNEAFSFGAEWSHMLTKPSNSAATIGTNFQGASSSVYSATVSYHLF